MSFCFCTIWYQYEIYYWYLIYLHHLFRLRAYVFNSMSSENELQISYYSAILAKALKENDGDQFTELYDQICKRATAQEVIDYNIKWKVRPIKNNNINFCTVCG